MIILIRSVILKSPPSLPLLLLEDVLAKRQRKNLSPLLFQVKGSDTEMQILSSPQHREKVKSSNEGNALWKNKSYGKAILLLIDTKPVEVYGCKIKHLKG